jgi:chemotaxis protein CheZ
MSDDVDLEALFDQISAKSLPASTGDDVQASASASAPAPTLSQDPPAEPEDQSDKPMYERLGGIVRLLHDSMRELGYDRSLTDVASQIGDAQGRLEYVATLTEQAANKVLNAIDQSMPEQEQLSVSASDINKRWEQLFAGELSLDEFKALANDSKGFAATVLAATETQKSRMLEIMMAQDFQDITGQLIKKIVTITAVAERELAQLLRDNAPPEIKAAIADKPVELLNGPSTPGAALEQNDVDDLLDSLGF